MILEYHNKIKTIEVYRQQIFQHYNADERKASRHSMLNYRRWMWLFRRYDAFIGGFEYFLKSEGAATSPRTKKVMQTIEGFSSVLALIISTDSLVAVTGFKTDTKEHLAINAIRAISKFRQTANATQKKRNKSMIFLTLFESVSFMDMMLCIIERVVPDEILSLIRATLEETLAIIEITDKSDAIFGKDEKIKMATTYAQFLDDLAYAFSLCENSTTVHLKVCLPVIPT